MNFLQINSGAAFTITMASESFAEFKRKLIALIRPVKKTIYGISDLKGIRNITKLHVKFNDLNAHKIHHNFVCLRPICNCGVANEGNKYYLLHFLRFNQLREDLCHRSAGY